MFICFCEKSVPIHPDVGKTAKAESVGCHVGKQGRLPRLPPLRGGIILKALDRRPHPIDQINGMHAPWLI